MATAYDIKMNCRTGTRSLHDSTSGCYWEDDYHVITHCWEYHLKEAEDTVERLANASPQEVRKVWYEEVEIPA